MGTLQKGGVELGRHRTCSPYNWRGNREDLDVVKLHEDVLTDNAVTWDNPILIKGQGPFEQVLDLAWADSHYESARKILCSNHRVAIWGFKDPRTLLMVQQWREIFPDIEFVGIFRHPLSVAKSLCERPSFPITFDHGLELWWTYNRILLEEHRRSPFPIVSFDWTDGKLFRAFDALSLQLGLNPVDRAEHFFEPSLRHVDSKWCQSLSTHLAATYNELSSIADVVVCD